MEIVCLATTDYDGTLAHDGAVHGLTTIALRTSSGPAAS